MDEFVRLAKETIENYIVTGLEEFEMPTYVTAELKNNQAGAFVSIHEKNGDLRGCIGTIAPTQPSLAMEIAVNAISAATRDPRFEPIAKEELNGLVIGVDVLSKPEQINSISELDPKKYGVIIEKGRKRGLLLPDLEGVDTVEQQVDIAMRKAGIMDGLYDCKLYRFTVTRHE